MIADDGEREPRHLRCCARLPKNPGTQSLRRLRRRAPPWTPNVTSAQGRCYSMAALRIVVIERPVRTSHGCVRASERELPQSPLSRWRCARIVNSNRQGPAGYTRRKAPASRCAILFFFIKNARKRAAATLATVQVIASAQVHLCNRRDSTADVFRKLLATSIIAFTHFDDHDLRSDLGRGRLSANE